VNRTDRLYALVEELRAVAPRPRSARWLADRFEVSSRTVERDLSALQQSGVPIWAEPGRTGGYCLDTAHTLPPLGFTADEALAITVALGTLTTSPFRGPATSALAKVVAVMDEGRIGQTAQLASRILYLHDETPAKVPDGLAEAFRSGTVLRIDYRDRAGASTTREVEPLGYVGRAGSWYLIGWCRLRDGLRAFRGDRIAAASATGERPPRRPFGASDLDAVSGHIRAASL
jgi:predicted DNA-binding transcriptional regulator YafY